MRGDKDGKGGGGGGTDSIERRGSIQFDSIPPHPSGVDTVTFSRDIPRSQCTCSFLLSVFELKYRSLVCYKTRNPRLYAPSRAKTQKVGVE